MDNNEIMARNNGSVSNLKLNDGALEIGSSDVTVAGDLSVSSTADGGPILNLISNDHVMLLILIKKVQFNFLQIMMQMNLL